MRVCVAVAVAVPVPVFVSVLGLPGWLQQTNPPAVTVPRACFGRGARTRQTNQAQILEPVHPERSEGFDLQIITS